jgi:hypothetical protein
LKESGFYQLEETRISHLLTGNWMLVQGKEMPMSPYEIVVVMILSALFIVLSVIPLLPGPSDLDVSRRVSRTKKKAIH